MADQADMARLRLGIIGGLGPLATAIFLEQVIAMTDASCDQEHIEMIIYNFPTIPDRTRYILGQSADSPVGPMADIGRNLVEQGAGCIAIPCITAHYFYPDLARSIGRPIIHMVRQTARHLQANGIRSAGIAATDGTLATRLFQNELDGLGIKSVIPSEARQRILMDLIYGDIKAGRPADPGKFHAVAEDLRSGGAEAIVLGCTELSLVKRDSAIGPGYLDALDVLAMESVISCHYPLKPRYTRLIT